MAASDEHPVSFRVMTQADAVEISGWQYPPPYDFYDATADAGDLAELLDPKLRAGTYLAAVDRGGAVVGFAQLVADGGTVDVGLGLRPDLTGRGLRRVPGGGAGGGAQTPCPRAPDAVRGGVQSTRHRRLRASRVR
jgi:hypothetical protein